MLPQAPETLEARLKEMREYTHTVSSSVSVVVANLEKASGVSLTQEQQKEKIAIALQMATRSLDTMRALMGTMWQLEQELGTIKGRRPVRWSGPDRAIW